MSHLLRSAPYFLVADVQRSATFYAGVLGFQCDYMAGSPPEFAICSRDGLAVMFRRASDPDLIRPIEAQGGTWDAFFWVDDAVGLHDEFVEKMATVVYGPVVQEAYQMREFAIRDCDGHVLGFGQTHTS